MRQSRLFSPIELVAGTTIALGPEQANYVARVLRLRKGDALRLFDGTGGEFDATLLVASKKGLQLSVEQHVATDCESPLRVQLIQCISRGERMDLVMQKSTELGVHHISPAISDFSVIKLDVERAVKRRDHWHKVIASACEQSGRNRLPELDVPAPLADVLSGTTATTRLVLHPDTGRQLSAIPAPAGAVCLLVGPEGGLSEKEFALAADAGFTAVSLGPRVLRTETAAIAALAVVQNLWGDLGAD